jgi:hypothetical protein
MAKQKKSIEPPQHKLICRKGFGYVLVVRISSTETYITKTPDWPVMRRKIKLAEELFGCKCSYEGMESPAEDGGELELRDFRQSEIVLKDANHVYELLKHKLDVEKYPYNERDLRDYAEALYERWVQYRVFRINDEMIETWAGKYRAHETLRHYAHR